MWTVPSVRGGSWGGGGVEERTTTEGSTSAFAVLTLIFTLHLRWHKGPVQREGVPGGKGGADR